MSRSVLNLRGGNRSSHRCCGWHLHHTADLLVSRHRNALGDLRHRGTRLHASRRAARARINRRHRSVDRDRHLLVNRLVTSLRAIRANSLRGHARSGASRSTRSRRRTGVASTACGLRNRRDAGCYRRGIASVRTAVQRNAFGSPTLQPAKDESVGVLRERFQRDGDGQKGHHGFDFPGQHVLTPVYGSNPS